MYKAILLIAAEYPADDVLFNIPNTYNPVCIVEPMGIIICLSPMKFAVNRFEPALELVVAPPAKEKLYDTDDVPLFHAVIEAAPVHHVSKRLVDAGSVSCDHIPTLSVCPTCAVAAEVIVPE